METTIDFDLSKLNVSEHDAAVIKLFMLIEGVYGMGVQASIKKYDYTEQRYYQLLKEFKQFGIEALENKKTGPKNNHVRTDAVVKQIIRLRFLDPDASAAVISQKLNQQGIEVSKRSVERTIQEYGLQKKTPHTSG